MVYTLGSAVRRRSFTCLLASVPQNIFQRTPSSSASVAIVHISFPFSDGGAMRMLAVDYMPVRCTQT